MNRFEGYPADPESCGLPQNYFTLSRGGQYAARMDVLTGWFDRRKPHVFCADVEKLILALRLWVEHYIKPDPCNAGIYHYRDPDHKYEMVRKAFSPPLVGHQPAKTVLHAPRGSTKTITFIQQLSLMAAIVRPSTEVLISEKTAKRTGEEIRKVRLQVQQNKRIQRDFGVKGTLFPRSRMDGIAWNDSQLDFVHLPGCRILAHSIASAQRGRHPLLWVIDDPEQKRDARNPKFRKQFFEDLFSDTLPMIGPGGCVAWIATTPDYFSCIEMAMQGMTASTDEFDDPILEKDDRFDSWTKVKIRLAEKDENGNWTSVWEDKHPAASMPSLIKSMGIAAFEAEMQGNPIASEQFVFQRDEFLHGYAQARDAAGGLWMLDLNTGEKVRWDEFISECAVFAGLDLADSLARYATPGAIVAIGMRRGIVFVLDAFVKRVHADKLVEKALNLASKLGCRVLGIEKGGMQNVCYRIAQRYQAKIRDEGGHVPVMRPIINARKDKVKRIDAALTPLFIHNEIRIPTVMAIDRERMQEILDEHGLKELVRHPHAAYIREICEEADRFTDDADPEGFDALDALEMAIRVSGSTKGAAAVEHEEPNDAMVERLGAVGIHVDPRRLPEECWTKKMWEDYLEAEFTPIEEPIIDPYD